MATKITGTVGGEPLIEVEIGGVFYPWKQGIQNWATVSAVTGSPTTGTYTDADGVGWTYWQWTGNGSVTTTAGVVDALIVGGGGGNFRHLSRGDNFAGGGGAVFEGIKAIGSGTHNVVVGANGANRQGYDGGDANQTYGFASTIGTAFDSGRTAYGFHRPPGQTANLTSIPYTSNITGTPLLVGSINGNGGVYGAGSPNNTGASTAGVVIIRVPSQFDQV